MTDPFPSLLVNLPNYGPISSTWYGYYLGGPYEYYGGTGDDARWGIYLPYRNHRYTTTTFLHIPPTNRLVPSFTTGGYWGITELTASVINGYPEFKTLDVNWAKTQFPDPSDWYYENTDWWPYQSPEDYWPYSPKESVGMQEALEQIALEPRIHIYCNGTILGALTSLAVADQNYLADPIYGWVDPYLSTGPVGFSDYDEWQGQQLLLSYASNTFRTDIGTKKSAYGASWWGVGTTGPWAAFYSRNGLSNSSWNGAVERIALGERIAHYQQGPDNAPTGHALIAIVVDGSGSYYSNYSDTSDTQPIFDANMLVEIRATFNAGGAGMDVLLVKSSGYADNVKREQYDFDGSLISMGGPPNPVAYPEWVTYTNGYGDGYGQWQARTCGIIYNYHTSGMDISATLNWLVTNYNANDTGGAGDAPETLIEGIRHAIGTGVAAGDRYTDFHIIWSTDGLFKMPYGIYDSNPYPQRFKQRNDGLGTIDGHSRIEPRGSTSTSPTTSNRLGRGNSYM